MCNYVKMVNAADMPERAHATHTHTHTETRERGGGRYGIMQEGLSRTGFITGLWGKWPEFRVPPAAGTEETNANGIANSNA